MERDGTGWDEKRRDEMGWDKTGRNGMRRNGTGRNETGQDGMGWDGTGRDGWEQGTHATLNSSDPFRRYGRKNAKPETPLHGSLVILLSISLSLFGQYLGCLSERSVLLIAMS